MFRKVWIWALAFFLVIGIAVTANAQPGKWVRIGESHVDGHNDHDTIHVNSSDAFRALQIRVQGSAVHFDHIVVRYGNGEKDELNVREVIQPGQSSRQIDLQGARRKIDKIDVWYEKAKWANKPTVSFFGIK
jgi:hypothetical protein